MLAEITKNIMLTLVFKFFCDFLLLNYATNINNNIIKDQKKKYHYHKNNFFNIYLYIYILMFTNTIEYPLLCSLRHTCNPNYFPRKKDIVFNKVTFKNIIVGRMKNKFAANKVCIFLELVK